MSTAFMIAGWVAAIALGIAYERQLRRALALTSRVTMVETDLYNEFCAHQETRKDRLATLQNNIKAWEAVVEANNRTKTALDGWRRALDRADAFGNQAMRSTGLSPN